MYICGFSHSTVTGIEPKVMVRRKEHLSEGLVCLLHSMKDLGSNPKSDLGSLHVLH